MCDDLLSESLYEIGAALRVQNSLNSTFEWVETGELLPDLRHLLRQRGVDVDEEVNLVYVGMTRAEKKLTVATKLGAWLDMCGVSFRDSVESHDLTLRVVDPHSHVGVCYD